MEINICVILKTFGHDCTAAPQVRVIVILREKTQMDFLLSTTTRMSECIKITTTIRFQVIQIATHKELPSIEALCVCVVVTIKRVMDINIMF